MRRMTDSIRDYALEIIRLLTNLQVGGGGGGTGDASSANQLTTINSLSDILTELRDDKNVSSDQVVDSNGTVLFREITVDQNTGNKAYEFRDASGNTATPTLPLVADTSTDERKDITTTRLSTTANGTIPADTISYSITNLGDGTNNAQTDIIVDGITIPSVVNQITVDGNSRGKYPAVNYVTNGNTLFIQYETEV